MPENSKPKGSPRLIGIPADGSKPFTMAILDGAGDASERGAQIFNETHRLYTQKLSGYRVEGADGVEMPKGQTSFLPDATTKEQLAAAAKAKGRPSASQQGMDDGLFGSGMNQTDLVEMAKKLPEPSQVDRKPWKVMDTDTGKPVYAFETSKEARQWASVHNADEADSSGRKSRYGVERAVPETKQAAAVAKIQDQLTEMFSRSPDGKQNSTDGTPLPERHSAALTQTENTGKPAQVDGKALREMAKWDHLSDTPQDRATIRQAIEQLSKVALETKSREVADRVSALNRMSKTLDEHGRVWMSGLDRSWLNAAADSIDSAKPAGWSDAAREASATAREAKDVRSMNLKELRAEAKAQGIRLGSAKTKAQITERLERGKPNIFGSDNKYGRGAAPKATASDPFAVNLTLTAQRDGRFAIQDALDKMSPKQVRAAAKAQGIYISASTPDADVKMTTVKAAFTKVAERIAAAGGDASKYRQEIAEIERNMRTASLVPKAEDLIPGLRGTQNAANREAIAKNRKANAKGDVAGLAREIASLSDSGDMAKADSLRAQVEKMSQSELRALVKERNGRAPAKSANKRKLLSYVLGDIANGAEAKSKRASIDKLTKWPEGKPRKQMFIAPDAPAAAATSTPVSAKPTALARAGHAFNVAGTAGLGVGIAAAAVIAANESAKAGESGGKQAAAAATAATVAAAPAAVVGGGLYAAAKWGGKTAVKAVPIVGWGIAAAAAAHGAYTEGMKASAEGKGAAGIAKAAGWGAVNSVVPIDAAVEASRGVRGRLSSGQAAQFREANAAFQRDQQMHTTQTDHSDRKPGWSPEARIAAAKAKGVSLPYGGVASNAPSFIPAKTLNGKAI